MTIRQILPIVLLFILASCSDNEMKIRKVDIQILIETSEERDSHIETLVFGPGLELRTNSTADYHVPYHQVYNDQEIPELSSVGATYRDLSPVVFGQDFEPYTLYFTILINGDEAVYKEFTVDESGYTQSVDLFLPDYFKSK